jgi:hypothetical protein
MNVTRRQVVTVGGFIVSSLLIIIAAGCSFQKRSTDEAGQNHIEGGSSERQDAEESSPKVVFVANQFCSACHYGFMDEELARTHERAGIGCERCHGESDRHRSDENNATPPQIMYPKSRINPTCMMCHPRHEINRVASHKKLLTGARTVFDSAEQKGDQIYCTDCHAKSHHINVRTIRWNKQTGELIED